jgi:hypothetical protein
MKKLIALILAVCMLAGCQLASVEKKEDPNQDKLVGVFVTFEPMELGFDIEGWIEDNGITDGAEISMEESLQYQEKRPVTLSDEGWVVPGYEGISVGRYWNGEYWTGFSGEGICEMNSNIAAGDDGDNIKVEGTVYFPEDAEVMLCTNPVYQTPEGEFYVVQGQSFHSNVGTGSMSQSVRDEKTWTENGTSHTFCAEFKTTVQGVELAEKVVLVWMTADHTEVSRAEYDPNALPETVTPAEGAAYLIVEEIAGENITRTIYQPEDEQITVYYRGEQPWCMPKFTELLWENR